MSSRGVNKIILAGNLGADPETRSFPDGGMVSNINIATTEAWKDKQTGQQQERTEWTRVVFRGKLAEVVAQYLRKGSKVYVEGSLRTRKYQGQDGTDRFITEVHAREMQMLDSRTESAGGAGQSRPSANTAGGQGAGMPPNEYAQASGGNPPAFDDFQDDSIPF